LAFLAPLQELENCLLLVMMLRIPNTHTVVSEDESNGESHNVAPAHMANDGIKNT